MGFSSTNAALSATFSATVEDDVIHISADTTPSIAVNQQITYINNTSTTYNLLGTFEDGETTKPLEPGEAVTLTLDDNGDLFIVSGYDNDPAAASAWSTAWSSGFSSVNNEFGPAFG